MMTISAVIFDIGNVLIEWNPERYYDRAIGVDRRRALFDAVDLHAMNHRVDMGEPFRDVIYETADQHPEFRDEIRQWHDNWIELASPVIDHSVALLRALRAKHIPVYALTNFGVESYAYAQTQFDVLNEFDLEFVSGRMKVMKPDPQIYHMVEQATGLRPDQMIFADDRADNIAVAAARGGRVHHFTSAKGWGETLVAHGLLTASEAGLA
jgi:2-haloacid dehalogenase